MSHPRGARNYALKCSNSYFCFTRLINHSLFLPPNFMFRLDLKWNFYDHKTRTDKSSCNSLTSLLNITKGLQLLNATQRCTGFHVLWNEIRLHPDGGWYSGTLHFSHIIAKPVTAVSQRWNLFKGGHVLQGNGSLGTILSC